MEFLTEIIALSVDTVILAICCKLYYKYNNKIYCVQEAKKQGINPDVRRLKTGQLGDYVIVEGNVKAVGSPIQSSDSPHITGVVQKTSTKDHAIIRHRSGFWSDEVRTLQVGYNTVPFVLEKAGYKVEVLDPLSAELLSLDTISDHFEAAKLSTLDVILGTCSGRKQLGLQTTEEMLKEGTLITAIGAIKLSSGGKKLQIMAPEEGKSYYLINYPVEALLKELDNQRFIYRWMTVVSGTMALVLLGLLARRWWESRTRLRARRQLEITRRERRQALRDADPPPENLRCVVCRLNQREVILLPCGHVCLCEDCSDLIKQDCPLCREPITSRALAFIS